MHTRPLRPGNGHRQGHGLFATAGTGTGNSCASSARVAKVCPRIKLHIVADDYATHKHPDVTAWLAKNPRITLHFTPTPGRG